MDEIGKQMVEQNIGVVAEAYKDLVQPAARPLGEILGLFPRTLRLAFSGWEKWLTNREESLQLTALAIEEKVKRIPEEKVVEPEAYVAIPAIQQLSYCQNSVELRDMYANLLVASMNIDTKWQVHPAFVDIIKQLTPDEARFLNSVKDIKNNFLPLLDVKGISKGQTDGGHQLLITNFTTVGFDVIENKDNICGYVDNLVRLNLFEIPPTYHLTDMSKYDSLKTNLVLERKVFPYRQFYDIDYRYKVLVISNLGLSFKRVCCAG